MTGDLPWRTVWITGASSGIGRELARALDGRVGRVAISARSADRLLSLAAGSRSMKDYPLDVTDAPAVAATVAGIEAEAGPIDLAVLGAGVWHLLEPGKLDLPAIRDGMEVNYLGTVNCLAALVPRMVRAPEGSHRDRGLDRRLSRPAAGCRLRADEGGAHQPRGDAPKRARAARHHRVRRQSRLRRHAAHARQPVSDARAHAERRGGGAAAFRAARQALRDRLSAAPRLRREASAHRAERGVLLDRPAVRLSGSA